MQQQFRAALANKDSGWNRNSNTQDSFVAIAVPPGGNNHRQHSNANQQSGKRNYTPVWKVHETCVSFARRLTITQAELHVGLHDITLAGSDVVPVFDIKHKNAPIANFSSP